jgi:hypothetical protein
VLVSGVESCEQDTVATAQQQHRAEHSQAQERAGPMVAQMKLQLSGDQRDGGPPSSG